MSRLRRACGAHVGGKGIFRHGEASKALQRQLQHLRRLLLSPVRPCDTRGGTLRYFLKGSVLLFAASIGANLLLTLFSALIPQVISFTVDVVIGAGELGEHYALLAGLSGSVEFLRANIWIPALVVCGLAALTAGFHFLCAYLTARANQTFLKRMRDRLFSHILRLPLRWHRANLAGDIIQRCTSDVDTISNFVANQLIMLFRIVILTAISLALMFAMNPALAAVSTAFFPLLLLYSYLFYRRATKSFRNCDENEGILSALAQENFSGVRIVRAFGKERFERDKFERQNVYYTGLWVKIEKYLAMFWATSDLLIALQLMAIIAAGSVFCVQGVLTPGQLIAFVSYNTMLQEPMRQLGRIISNLSKAGVSIDRIAEIMNEPEEDARRAQPLGGDIVFEDVSFSYGGSPVLEHIDLKIPEGTTLGIIGATGSGKSTLVALLDKLYPVTEGRITIGGKDISDLSPATLRKSVGLILQEGTLFSRTVSENIALAAEADRPRVEEAARLASVHENIMGFARGYDTVVGERGVTLSGGQKQRVAIARTLLRETPYLVFDDSLSAVDSETDARIRANLKEKLANKTVILISHRVMTVMHADNIAVLDGGRIAEQGTHTELLAQGGLYRTIYDLQMSLPDDLKEDGDGR